MGLQSTNVSVNLKSDRLFIFAFDVDLIVSIGYNIFKNSKSFSENRHGR